MILDAHGNSAVIEFVNGKMMVYRDSDMPYEVLEKTHRHIESDIASNLQQIASLFYVPMW